MWSISILPGNDIFLEILLKNHVYSRYISGQVSFEKFSIQAVSDCLLALFSNIDGYERFYAVSEPVWTTTYYENGWMRWQM